MAPEADDRVEQLLEAVRSGTGADGGAELYLDDGEGALQLVAEFGPSAKGGRLGRFMRPPIDNGRVLMMDIPDARGGLLVLRRLGNEEFSFTDRAVARLYARQLAERVAASGLQPRSTFWTRQLEAIQRISAQLTRLGTLEEVAMAICAETRQVIDYDNARVYVLASDGVTLEPIAFKSRIQEYDGETADGLRLRVGEGITGWVAERGEPLIVPDTSRDPRALEVPGTRDGMEESMLLVPLQDEGQVTGVIVLAKLGVGRFAHDDLRLLQILSDHAAVSIENARLLAGRDRLVSELNWMLDISQTYAQADDELTLAPILATKLTQAAHVDACIISRWDESAGFLRTLGAHGTVGVDGPWDVLGSPIARKVLREATPAIIQFDPTGDPDELRLMSELGAQTLLLVPLMAAGRTIGLVELFHVRTPRFFTADDLSVYRTMANQAGAVLDNVRLLDQLRQAADVDQLTGVNNHRYLQERLKQEAARSARSHVPFSILMVDLDGFKGINDKHGHADGDRVLRTVASGLKLAVRGHDIVARYGGDEFVVFMPDTSEDQARVVAKRVVAGVRARKHELSDGTIAQISASAGLAVFPVDGRTPAVLLHAADAAMYAVKRQGGSNVGRVSHPATV